ERLRELYRALLVAQTIEENGEGELLGAVTLVGPLEAEAGEALDLVVLLQPLAIDRDDEAVDGAPALVHSHSSHHHGCAGKAFHIIHQLVACALRRIGVAFGDSARLIGVQPPTHRPAPPPPATPLPK